MVNPEYYVDVENMTNDAGIHMICTGGACPEQYEGTVDENPAYFRLRHSHWKFTIVKPGASPYGGAKPDEILYQKDGEHEPGQDAGVMENARDLISSMVLEFRRGSNTRLKPEHNDGEGHMTRAELVQMLLDRNERTLAANQRAIEENNKIIAENERLIGSLRTEAGSAGARSQNP